MRVAALQLASIGMSTTKLYHYIRIASSRGVKLLLLGEYMLNSFFKELVTTPITMIEELSTHQVVVLKELCATYDLTIVAPLVVIRNNKAYKMIVTISPNSVEYHPQQILINYDHWNEESFFDNEIAPITSIPTFKLDGVCFGVVSGFELHFDLIWRDVLSKKIECVLLPSASTFDSNQRWRALIQTRSFTNNCYILRANRIGSSVDGEHSWHFYGDSLICNPDGVIEESLVDKEELLVADIDTDMVAKARRDWRFEDAISRRG